MPGGDFEEMRGIFLSEVEANTEALIVSSGFDFGGKHFALDLPSRQKWLALKTLESALSWPCTISSTVGEFVLAEADLAAFLGSALSVVQGYKDSGRALRLELEAATGHVDLMAFKDTR